LEISFSPQGTSGFLRKSFYSICRYEFGVIVIGSLVGVLILKKNLVKEYCRIVLALLASSVLSTSVK
jgi:hypothetical protein